MSLQRNRIVLRGTAVAALALATLLSGPPAWSGEPGKAFATPDEAAKALVAAYEKGDDFVSVLAILGADAADLVRPASKDPGDKKRFDAFLVKAKEAVGTEAEEDGTVDVVFGSDRWPFPIPLVKGDGGWRYDIEAGRKEILARVIGFNELGAVDLLGDLVTSQEAYEAVDRDGDDVREYAQKFNSTPGKKDGLWWDDAKVPSPLGLQVGDFLDEVAKNATTDDTVYGYQWKMLKGQGAKAPGGAFSYVINGHQVAGFAFVATPAAYKKTGVMTFLVSKSGKILEKDLGEQGADIVKAMEVYEPDDTWTPYEAEKAGDDEKCVKSDKDEKGEKK